MTDPTQSLKDDIAFLRELTHDSGQGMAREGATMLTVGAVFSVVTFIYWLMYAGLLGPAWRIGYVLWAAGVAAMVVISLVLKQRLPGASGATARAIGAAWGGTGISMLAACGGMLIGAFRIGNPNLVLWIFPIVLFTLYGAGWGVAYAARRRGWFAWIALGCFLTAGVEGVLLATPHQWLVLSLGLLAWVAVPGAVILRPASARAV